MRTVAGELAALREEVSRYKTDTITSKAAVEIIKAILLTRIDEPIDSKLADERARNIVAALIGFRIGE